MNDEADDGTRVGLWVTLGIITLLLFGLLAGLLMRQQHKAKAMVQTAAPVLVPSVAGSTLIAPVPPLPDANPVAATASLPDAELDVPLSGAVAGTLYFDSASAALATNAGDALAAIRDVANANPLKRLMISGFHDATGSAEKNAVLAKERAIAVREALAGLGVDRARLFLRKPEMLVGGSDMAQARRVEVRSVD